MLPLTYRKFNLEDNSYIPPFFISHNEPTLGVLNGAEQVTRALLFTRWIRVCLLEVSSYLGHWQRSWHIHSSDTQRIWLWNYNSPTRPNVEIMRLGSSQNHKEHGDPCHIQGKVSGVFVASHPLHISPLSQTRAPGMKVITTTYSTIFLRKNKSQNHVQGVTRNDPHSLRGSAAQCV